VSLKILIADDSMTAQNMGKKILADAGFDVVPVSNGAAAIKKIAETKPDIIILDIYMPGYTGLEVCEKVKNAPETANVPVLLTVGKLEPYRPEDGAKVKAEGVIIKPFEASDLLSALGRIAEKYNLNVPQVEAVEIEPPAPSAVPEVTAAAATVTAAVAHEFPMTNALDDYQPMLAHAHVEAAASAAVEAAPVQASAVPEFIREATAAAAAASPIAAPSPMFIIEEETAEENSAPAFDLSDLSPNEAPAYLVDEISIPDVPEAIESFKASSIRDEDPTAGWSFSDVAEAPASVDASLETFANVSLSEPAQVEPELEPTATASVEVPVENLMELEAAPESPVEVQSMPDPALATQPDDLNEFTVHVGSAAATAPEVESEHVSHFAAVAPSNFEDEIPVVAEYSDEPMGHHSYQDDPMVQMGAISIESTPEPSVEFAPASNVGDDTMRLSLEHSSGLEGALHEYEAAVEADAPSAEVVAQDANEVAAVEPEPFGEIVPEGSYASSLVAQMAAATPELAEPMASETAHHQDFAHSVTDAVEAAVEHGKEETKTLAAAAGLDASVVARAVQRVFERYKAQMVADITDELSKGD
jgi:CheY-like chemotaxis protein